MEVVLVDSQPYDSYATLLEAQEYAAAAFHAASFRAATELNQSMALVTATRVLDRQRWLRDYDTQEKRGDVQAVKDGCIEMAIALVDGSELQSEQSTAQKLQSITAGSVSLSYFRGAEGRPKRFPLIVHELLHDYLAGSGVSLAGIVSGTGGTSSTEDDFGHSGGI